VRLQQVLCPPLPLGLWEPGSGGVDFSEELGKEAGSSSCGDLTRIVPSVHRISGQRGAKRSLLVGEGNRSGQQTTFRSSRLPWQLLLAKPAWRGSD
jgi:hypothetical protein